MKSISQDVVVTKDDQKSINNFSRMYSKHQEIAQELTDLKEKFQKNDDTLTELQLNQNDDQVKYRFGNCFFYISTEQARELVESEKNKVQKLIKAKKEESDQNDKRMRKLKAALYSKFGNSINLQE